MSNLPDNVTPRDVDDAAAGRYGDMGEREYDCEAHYRFSTAELRAAGEGGIVLDERYRIIRPSEGLEAFERAYEQKLRTEATLDVFMDMFEAEQWSNHAYLSGRTIN